MKAKKKTMLTPNFSIEELTQTSTGIDNTPNDKQMANIINVAKTMEIVRMLLGDKPIIVNSCFRSEAVNVAVGGSNTSDHCKGLAIDFNVKGMSAYDVCVAIANNPSIQFSQLILEYRGKTTEWVHLSVAGNKRQIMTMTPNASVGLKERK